MSAADINHMIIFLTREHLRAEQARCTKHESALNIRINSDMTRLIRIPRGEYGDKYDAVLEMAAEAGQWHQYRIELGAMLWSLDQI